MHYVSMHVSIGWWNYRSAKGCPARGVVDFCRRGNWQDTTQRPCLRTVGAAAPLCRWRRALSVSALGRAATGCTHEQIQW